MNLIKKTIGKSIYQISTFNYFFLILSVFIISCKEQNKKDTTQEEPIVSKKINTDALKKGTQKTKQNYQIPYVNISPDPDLEISKFVRRIFQDKSGNLWFGTNGDGVARYNGESLDYFSIQEGFGGLAVRGIVADKEGNIWFGTERGLTKYDGASFINYTEKDGLINNDVWSIAIDRNGIIWIATLQGLSRFNGKAFSDFILPAAAPDYNRGVTSAKIVHSIMEDSKGKMWFGTSEGAYVYDGVSLTNISEKDGLCNNAVNDILEDKKGNIWFATHYKGVCFWDGASFTQIATKERASGTEAWSLYEDKFGQIWFPIENFGVYRYHTNSLINFNEKDGLASTAIQCIFEDKEGRLWLGGYMGLFRYDGISFYNVGKNGPW
jgi:ligand-binding sensor domain-containing protein